MEFRIPIPVFRTLWHTLRVCPGRMAFTPWHSFWVESRRITISNCASAFCCHIATIVSMCTDKYVGWVAAPTIGQISQFIAHIALVANQQRVRIFTSREKVGQSVDPQVPVGCTEHAVPLIITPPPINPAIVWSSLIDHQPQLGDVLFGERGKWFAIVPGHGSLILTRGSN